MLPLCCGRMQHCDDTISGSHNSVRIVFNIMIPVVIGNETKNFVEFSSLPGQYLTLASTIDRNRLAGYGPITGEEQHGRGNFLGFHHSIQQAI